MKNKSHKSKWAMTLCAVALFSFTAAHAAQTRLPTENLDQGKQPQTTTDQTGEAVPLPDGPVLNGFFSGTVID